MGTKKSELVLTCNATAIKDVMNFLNQKMDELIRKRDQLNEKGQHNWTAQDKKNFKQWGDDIAAINSAMQKNRDEMLKYGQVMKDLAGSKTNDLRRALGEVKRALDNMSARDPKRAQLEQDFRRIQKQIDANTVSVNRNTSAWGALGTTLKNLVAYAGVFALFNKMKSLFEDIIKLNKEFSDQLANIRKVSGLAMSDINQLATRLAKIDTRSTVQELNELAYAGAKLGFGNMGVDALEGFVKSALKVQNALKEDMGEDSMTALSKLVEVMGLIPKMGVERAMDAAGSAIFKLASTSTATGANIIEFTKRLMGLANVSHVTTAELLALGSASDSMGLMAEVSSTAFTKMFTSIQSNYTAIEQAVGLSKGTLKDLLDQGKTMEALVEVFDKMHGMSMEEMKARGIFKALGSEGSRMNNVMTTMANKIDMLRQHLLTSNEAFEEANAVAKEYEIQMETAQAYAERASNIWAKAFVNPEGVDVVKDFSKAWYEVSKSLTTNEKFMFSIQISLKGILLLLKGIMAILPELFAMLVSGSAWSFITRLREGEGLLASMTTWFGKLTAAQKAFFKAAGWVGLALAIYEVGKAIYDMSNKVKEANSFMKGFNSTLSDVNKEQYTSVKQLNSYVKAINDAKDGTNQRKAAINNFNKIYKPYLSAMLTEKSTADDIAAAYKEVVKQMKAKIALQAKEKDIEQHVNPRVKMEADKLERFDQSRGSSPYNGAWLKGYVEDALTNGTPLRTLAENLNKQGYGLSDAIFENAWKQRSNANFKDVKGVDLGDKDIMRLVNGRELWMAISYAAQAYSTNNAISRVNKKYKPWENDINDLLATEEEVTPTTPIVPTTTETKAPEWMVEEKKNAEKATKAVIGSIEEFYRLQEAAANELAANGQLEGKDFEMLIKHIQDRKDQMLLEARRAIVGDKNTWDTIKTELEGDLVKRDSEVSREAIKRIQEAEPAKQGAALRKYNGSDEVFGLDSNAYLNSIRNNAAQNELNIQRRQAAIQQEVDKILLQYEYVEQAQRKFGDKLVTLGLITDGYDKVVRQLADGTEIVANTRDVQALANKTVKMDARQFFGVDEDDALELRNMIDAIMHTVDEDGNKIREPFASMFPSLDEWMTNPEQYLEQMQVFYTALIDMDSDYYKALKQNYEQEKREFNERWQSMGWTAQQESENTAFETQDSLRKISGQGESFGQTYGFVDEIADDPEIARIKNRMEWRARELEDLQARNASEELIMEKQNEMLQEAAALAEKVSSEVAERIGKIQTLSEPLNAWGEEVGQMLGEMWQGISRDGKLTFGQMAKNMGIEYAKLTLKMMSENLTKKLQQALFYKTFEAQAMAHQSTLTAIEVSGGAARIAAESATNTALDTMESIHNSARVAKEAQIAAIMAMFGVSEGAAKTIATLGFWGIPLIGVITAVLMGLLSSAQSTANQESSKANAATPKVKLASGMLTYDEGNVKRFIGQDGKVYTATEEAQPRDGLVTHPIATTVQGQPALVAENGPEIVVGRKTTQAIMMNEPELIKYLANYDKYGGRGYRPYDSGNIEQVAAAITPQTSDNNGMTANDARALTAAINAFIAQCQKPLQAQINKYGTGGLIEEVKSGMKFMAKYQ